MATFELTDRRVDEPVLHPRAVTQGAPEVGTRRPWVVRDSFLLDSIEFQFDRIGESMVFGKANIQAGDGRRGRPFKSANDH